MTRFIAKRCVYALFSLFILSVTIFTLMRVTGDPVVLLASPEASEADLADLRKEFGLDRPWHIQYVQFMANAVQGNFGKSLYYRVPAGELYWQRLPASIELALASMAVSLLIGLSIGILSDVWVKRWWDRVG